KPATILTAIESGAQGMIEPPVMRFHADSGLLFVHGEPERIELVRQVLGNIESDQQMRRALTRGPGTTTSSDRPKDTAGKDSK
ncbi:MAG TPA: hypothetical protein VK348_12805, partial [Planctomycetota bacterium]|nr:hypothetical protein [Planctomycetota bacterium]